MADDKRGDLKKYFLANMIPTESNFHELIDEIVLSSNGLEKLKDEPLKIAAGDGKNKVLSLHQKLDSDAAWSLSLKIGDDRSGLSIDDKSGTSRIFIDENIKSIGIGTAELKAGYQLQVKGNLYVDGDIYAKNLRVDGKASKKDINAGLWNDWTGPDSDIRLKDTEDIKDALKKLLQLKGIHYAWKKEYQDKYVDDFDNKKHIGFIAQDVAKGFPDWISLGKTYKIGEEEFQALGIRINPTVFEFQALTVEAIREIDSKIKSISLDGLIKAQSDNASGQKGLLFSQDNGTAVAWMRCTGGADNVLEIGTTGNIRLNSGKNSMLIGDPAGKHLVIGSGYITAKESAASSGSLFLQQEGGGTEFGGALTVKGKLFLKNGIEATGTLSVIGDAVLGLNENNKRFIFHSRTNGNGDFLQITHDSASGGWDWGQGITLRRGGNVGIGTTNPTEKLHIAGNVSVTGNIYFGNQVRQMLNLWGKEYGIGVQGGTLYFRTADSYSWHLNGVHDDSFCNPGANGVRLMSLNSAGDLILSARTNPQVDPNKSMCRALVDANELLVINYANDYKKGVLADGDLWVRNKLRLGDKWLLSSIGDAHGNDEWLRFFDAAGGDYYGGVAAGKFWTRTGNYLSGSDIRKKKNICTLKDSLKKIVSLKGVQFEWKDAGSELGVQFGLIAQDVEHVFPEVVKESPDGIKGINYSGLIAPLIEAVKEQQIQLSILLEQVNKLNRDV